MEPLGYRSIPPCPADPSQHSITLWRAFPPQGGGQKIDFSDKERSQICTHAFRISALLNRATCPGLATLPLHRFEPLPVSGQSDFLHLVLHGLWTGPKHWPGSDRQRHRQKDTPPPHAGHTHKVFAIHVCVHMSLSCKEVHNEVERNSMAFVHSTRRKHALMPAKHRSFLW